jgi:hypothetical protein
LGIECTGVTPHLQENSADFCAKPNGFLAMKDLERRGSFEHAFERHQAIAFEEK